jgi:beta-phosphoglucomutase-like phosphatase (HAD superfamily)
MTDRPRPGPGRGADATGPLAAVLCDLDGTLIDGTLIDGDAAWMPGALDLLVLLRTAGIPAGLVADTPRALTDLGLGVLGRDRFAVTVCADEVPAGKPAPDPYLRAAELLGVRATDCLAVEDSPDGALSAERAGCAVLVVPDRLPVEAGPCRTHRPSLIGLGLADLIAARRKVEPTFTDVMELFNRRALALPPERRRR